MSDVRVSKYSRSAGIASYRRRRRQGKVAKFMVIVILLAIIGGSGFLVGRHYLDNGMLPFLQADKATKPDVEQPVEVIPTIQPVTVSLLSTGDVIMNSTVVESGRKDSGTYNFDHLFSHLVREIRSFDVRMVSQETALAGESVGYGYSRPLNAPQELGRSEAEAGFNVILRATDHTLDSGRTGIHNELAWWHEEFPDMPVLGIAEPDREANPDLTDYVSQVYVYDKSGFKIAILNHTWSIGEEDQAVVSALVEQKIAEDVARAREAGAEMIVACPHWGRESDTNLSDEETTFARVYANQGVDVVIGTHPRVLQRVEVLQNAEGHKTVCFYSLGCLVSSLYAQNFLGGLAEVTLSRDDQGACVVESAVLKPVVTHRGEDEAYSTYLVADYTDDLAQSSWDGGITPDDLARRCTEILGDAYDAEAGELRVDLNQVVPLEPEQPEEAPQE